MRDREALRLGIVELPGGGTLVDAGIAHPGGLEAGRRIAEICLAGLGQVQLSAGSSSWPLQLFVHTSNPVLACLGSQYAGWSLSHGKGKEGFSALGSGPGRSLALKEELFRRARLSRHCRFDVPGARSRQASAARDHREDRARLPDRVGAFDVDSHPLEVSPESFRSSRACSRWDCTRCMRSASRSTRSSMVGAAHRSSTGERFSEEHGTHERCDSLRRASAVVRRLLRPEAEKLAQELPASASRDYGKPFAQVFKEVEYDFYKIDPMLFAPAQVVVSNVTSGKSFRAGRVDDALLARSFGGEAGTPK